MLAQGNAIHTRIKDAVGLATDFEGAHCVSHGNAVSLLKADGSPLKDVEFDLSTINRYEEYARHGRGA